MQNLLTNRVDGTEICPRPPEHVMGLSRMGAFHPTRLSFMRILLRRLKAENWQFDRPVWEVDETGAGHAVYRAKGPKRTYSLVAFAHNLPDHLRSDRVIAEAWDSTFALFDGDPTPEDISRLAENVPKQEAGRVSAQELTLSRANRSVRLFDHVADRLASGQQPDRSELEKVGYLMRTTAVYGSAKFGLSDRQAIAEREEMSAPFQAEMLTVWLIRAFTIDIVEHMARVRGGDRAVALSPELRRVVGVGNATGLGMAPFLLNHPTLIHRWIAAREEAFARVRRIPRAGPGDVEALVRLIERARANAVAWRTDHPLQLERVLGLRHDLENLADYLSGTFDAGYYPWQRLWEWAEQRLCAEAQEQLVSLLIEPHGALVDDLADQMSCDEEETFAIDGQQSVRALKKQIADDYGWARNIDWSAAEAHARLWYVSAEKLEPRLAERADEPLEPYESALAPGRDIAAMADSLDRWGDDGPVSAFLMALPEHRHAVRRVQITARHAYAEIRDNTISCEMMPIDLLRAKLSFFGATRFDPRSDRWVRITMFQGAPHPCDMANCPNQEVDGWMLQ